MMQQLHLALSFAVVTATSFLPMIDPLGTLPIFTTMTERMPRAAARRVAIKASIVATVAIMLFAFFGEQLFELFGITLNGLRIVGGIVFFIMGYDMLQAHVARTKVADPPTPEDEDHLDDIAVTPLAIPLLCGPGAMTLAVLRMGKASGTAEVIGFVVGVVAVMALTFVMLIGGNRVAGAMGPSVSRVMLRLMGLLLMVMAVESFFGGLTPIVRDMLMLPA
ncbi:MAG: NAAT family transporter [Myxococcota bacterium]